VSIELWLLVALALTIAEVLAPGTFLIFLGLGAVMAGLSTLLIADLRGEILVFVASSGIALLFGRALYRRILSRRDGASEIGRGPVHEHGIVVDPIVDGRGKVKVRDTMWLAAGPDLPRGTAIVVLRREGTLLHVKPSAHPPGGTG
jgi:membrane protein implicated in regulation of membrane protease activity